MVEMKRSRAKDVTAVSPWNNLPTVIKTCDTRQFHTSTEDTFLLYCILVSFDMKINLINDLLILSMHLHIDYYYCHSITIINYIFIFNIYEIIYYY